MPSIRRRGPEDREQTSTLELFYDLVFVFAVTQISHYLLEHLSWEGAGQSLLILMVVWWSWNFTTWFTNELDPDVTAVRALMLALMLASMLMAVAIPEAFDTRALLFVGAYVTIQIGRQLFLTFAAAAAGTVERERALRILIWFCAAAVFWIGGGIAEGGARTALWLIALAIDYGGPLVTFRVPGLAPVDPEAWEVGSGHFAERFQLFVIIALGESIVLIGTSASGVDLDLARVVGLALAFVATAALWWLYFTSVADLTERGLERADRPTLVARDVYTYLHAALIAGIVVSAVGFELVIRHPTDALPGSEVLAVVAGPIIYLLAQLAMRLRMTRTVSSRRLIGAAGCAGVGLVFGSAAALVLGACLCAVLAALVIADQVAIMRRGRTEPAAGEA